MPSDNVIPLFPRRNAALRWRRRARAACGLAGALALALTPVRAVADGAAKLPPGHPPIGAEQLPPGHPPIGGEDDAASCSPDLPQGHPSIRDPRLPDGHPPVEIRPCGPGGGTFHPDSSSPSLLPGTVET